MDYREYLMHFGVMGMRWGHRSGASRIGLTKKRQEAFDEKGLKRLSEGKHLSVGITKKRQEAFDKRDKGILEKRITKAKNKKALVVEKKKAKILKSPTKLRKNLDKLTKEEVDTAMNKMKIERELRSLSRDKITTGSQFATSVLSYGTVASAAYGLYKSPLGQAISEKMKSAN